MIFATTTKNKQIHSIIVSFIVMYMCVYTCIDFKFNDTFLFECNIIVTAFCMLLHIFFIKVCHFSSR